MDGFSKYDKLRIKTDKQLVQIVINELDLGLGAALEALRSADEPALIKQEYVRARRAYTEASRLICMIYELTENERSRLELRRERLGRILEGLSALGSLYTAGDNEVAALARALWQARGCPEGSSEEDWFRAERALRSRRESVDCVVA